MTRTAKAIRAPELLMIRDGAATSYGAHQLWYPNLIKRMSGCGPTAAANLAWYLAAAHPEDCRDLSSGDGANRSDMLGLMEAMWHYVTPGLGGVNKASILADGLKRYGIKRGIPLDTQVLEVPADARVRPRPAQVFRFFADAFLADCPVAFLNLSNGAVRNLESWHWVTLISIDEQLQAEMYDQGRRQMLNLGLWLNTTNNGGAFVYASPENH